MIRTAQQESLRRDRAALVAALEAAGARVRGKAFHCPWHDDRSASGSLFAEDGVWHFRCHGCQKRGDVFDAIAEARGVEPASVLRETRGEADGAKPPRVFPSVEAMVESIGHWMPVDDVYAYHNPKTRKPDMIVVRGKEEGGKKKFIQARPVPAGFVQKAPPKPWPLFNRTQVADADTVVVVEGEKCVKALRRIGVVATTSPGGAENAKNANWAPLMGKGEVILWRDNDEAGARYMADVAEALDRLPLPPDKVREVDVPALDLKAGGDVVDYLAEYEGEDATDRRRAVQMVLDLAGDAASHDELAELIEETIAGRRHAVDWPWPILGNATQALLPGTITCICGDPGGAKSFFLLEAAWRLHADGTKVALYELEDDRAFHMNRMWAQLAENSKLTKAQWIYENPDAAREAYAKFRSTLRSFRPWIWDAPDQPPRLPEILEWVRARAAEGCRVVGIDPITAAASEDQQFLADQQFVLKAKAIARAHQCSIVVVTHPRIGHKGRMLDGLAGGAAYPRFSQTVLWVTSHEKRKTAKLKRPMEMPFTSEINRSVRLAKCRNGEGQGWEIGFNFDPGALRFAEQGLVLGDEEGGQP